MQATRKKSQHNQNYGQSIYIENYKNKNFMNH